MLTIISILLTIAAIASANFPIPSLNTQTPRSNTKYAAQIVSQVPPFDISSGYVKVDEKNDGNMFWWGYINKQQEQKSSPIVIWLQGGPGASSLYGDLCEIGPVDACDGTEKPRNSTWLSLTHALMFIDNPVGAGFSYVKNKEGYSKDEKQVASQLYQTLVGMYQKNPSFEGLPLYVFSESYGGKMASEFGAYLSDLLIANATLSKIYNFKGVGLGDSWISPMDCVKSYGTFLRGISHLDAKSAALCDDYATQMQKALDDGKYEDATNMWGQQQSFYSGETQLNVYNFLRHDSDDLSHLGVYANTVMRAKFGNIPASVGWLMQTGIVFRYMAADFMKDSLAAVEKLLKHKRKVIVFNGQLDIIVDTLSTENWLNRLKWDYAKDFSNAKQKLLRSSYPVNNIRLSYESDYAYRKKFDNLDYWRIMYAGHMVPLDNPVMAFEMLKTVLSDE